MFVYFCVYIHVVHMYTRTYMYACMNVCMYACMSFVCTCACTSARTNARIHVCMQHACMRAKIHLVTTTCKPLHKHVNFNCHTIKRGLRSQFHVFPCRHAKYVSDQDIQRHCTHVKHIQRHSIPLNTYRDTAHTHPPTIYIKLNLYTSLENLLKET